MKTNFDDLHAILERQFAAFCRETIRKFCGAESIPARFHDELRKRGLASILDGAVYVLYVEDASFDVPDLRGHYDPRSNTLTVFCHKALCDHLIQTGSYIILADPIDHGPEPVQPRLKHLSHQPVAEQDSLFVSIDNLEKPKAVDELNNNVN